MFNRFQIIILILTLCSGVMGAAQAAEEKAVDKQIQDLKKQVIQLNRDLFVLEEELLFPANTQVAVYLSMDVGTFFQLDSVEIKIDEDTVSHYLYTKKQVDALHRGGVQRLHVGNVKTGEHEITAFFIGKGPKGRDYKRGATFKFNKDTDAKMLELQIVDKTAKAQPEFSIKEW